MNALRQTAVRTTCRCAEFALESRERGLEGDLGRTGIPSRLFCSIILITMYCKLLEIMIANFLSVGNQLSSAANFSMISLG